MIWAGRRRFGGLLLRGGRRLRGGRVGAVGHLVGAVGLAGARVGAVGRGGAAGRVGGPPVGVVACHQQQAPHDRHRQQDGHPAEHPRHPAPVPPVGVSGAGKSRYGVHGLGRRRQLRVEGGEGRRLRLDGRRQVGRRGADLVGVQRVARHRRGVGGQRRRQQRRQRRRSGGGGGGGGVGTTGSGSAPPAGTAGRSAVPVRQSSGSTAGRPQWVQNRLCPNAWPHPVQCSIVVPPVPRQRSADPSDRPP